MGTGIGTAVANRVAAHGRVADEIALAQVDTFGPLALVTSGDSYTISQKTQDAAARNPRWVPAISTASTASIGAHVGTSGGRGRAHHLPLRLWPAALELWGIAPKIPKRANGRQRGGKTGSWSCRAGATRLAGGRGKGACAQRRDRGDGAWLQSLGMVASDLRGGRTGVDGRHRCPGRAPWHGQVRIDRSNVKFPPTDFNRIGTSYTSECGT